MKALEYFYGAVAVVGICLIIFHFIDMFQSFEPPKPKLTKYKFEAISLPDETPCYVVRGGAHSGLVGVTCNYRRVK